MSRFLTGLQDALAQRDDLILVRLPAGQHRGTLHCPVCGNRLRVRVQGEAQLALECKHPAHGDHLALVYLVKTSAVRATPDADTPPPTASGAAPPA